MKVRTAIGTVVGSFVSVALLAGLSPRPSYAAPTECTGVLTGVHDAVVVPRGEDCTLVMAQVLGNVRVESGASLLAKGPTVPPTTIGGNVHGIHSRSVFLQIGTQLAGNLHIHGGDEFTTSGFDLNTMIGGNARIELNAGMTFVDAAKVGGQLDISRNTGCMEVQFNTIGKNLRIEDNIIPPATEVCPPPPPGSVTSVKTGDMSVIVNTVSGNMQVLRNSGDGPKSVLSNTVVKKLVCRDNEDPFVGGPNFAAETEGQCF